MWDFQQAQSALTFLLEECDFDKKYQPVELRRFRCFETTAIVSIARPFQQTRGGSTLNLRVIDVRFDSQEQQLLDKVMKVRNTIVAHSTEEEMHYVADTVEIVEGIRMPMVRFDERLHFEEEEFLKLQKLLSRLSEALAKYFFRLAQESPEEFHSTKAPYRLKAPESD